MVTSHKTTPLRGGFTLIELMIVIIVIVILASAFIVAYNGVIDRAKATALKQDLQTAVTRIETDKSLTNSYPATLAEANNGKGIQAASGMTL